ncbi:MAG: SAM-dependent methyltransferase [Candidatus Azotimanducaceae bacterium]
MEPSPWVKKFANLIPVGAKVLDLACGKGRHTRYFIERSCFVTSVDINIDNMQDLSNNPKCQIIAADLENKDDWRLPTDFDAIIVTNYLHRPMLQHLPNALSPNGILIYQTFMIGNEAYGKPNNPDYLLAKNELKNTFQNSLNIIEFSEGLIHETHTAVTQQICAQLIIKP